MTSSSVALENTLAPSVDLGLSLSENCMQTQVVVITL